MGAKLELYQAGKLEVRKREVHGRSTTAELPSILEAGEIGHYYTKETRYSAVVVVGQDQGCTVSGLAVRAGEAVVKGNLLIIGM